MAGIGNYSKGKKFVLKSGNKPAFKMMGSSPHKNKNGDDKPSNASEFLQDMSDNRYKPGAKPNIGTREGTSGEEDLNVELNPSREKGKREEFEYDDPHHGRL